MAETSFPLPDTDWDATRAFWAGAERGKLVIPRCGGCGVYQCQRLFREIRTGRGHSRNRMSFVQRFFAGHNVATHKPQVVDRALGEVHNPTGRLG